MFTFQTMNPSLNLHCHYDTFTAIAIDKNFLFLLKSTMWRIKSTVHRIKPTVHRIKPTVQRITTVHRINSTKQRIKHKSTGNRLHITKTKIYPQPVSAAPLFNIHSLFAAHFCIMCQPPLFLKCVTSMPTIKIKSRDLYLELHETYLQHQSLISQYYNTL